MKSRWKGRWKAGILALAFLICGVSVGISGTALADGGTWKSNSKGWWYRYSDGTYAKNCWLKIGGKWYHFDGSGYMQTGWKMISGTWYFFASSGAMQTGWKKISGTWYYFASSGAMQTGWKKISGTWYFFTSSGAMQTGWKKISGIWYHFDTSGAMQTGWQKIYAKWYYFNASGAMQTGNVKISGKSYRFATGGALIGEGPAVPIDEAHFPDANFRAYIREAFDENKDGSLSNAEITLIWNVHCENMNIYSVKGIEYFHELRGLWCKGNHISELDLSGNPIMKGIWCSYNDFTSLDFSDCPVLEWVYCFNCKLKSLNIRNNPELAYLECNSNPDLTTLDISKNSKLENLFCSKCGLTSLDLSKNPLLCELAAFYNDLKTIDVSANPNLKRLDIWHNPKLGNVDVSKLSELQYYNCAWTAMTKIDVTHNPELLELVCGYNKGIRSIDLSHNPKLAYFACECDVNLQSLDLSHNPRLYYLLAFGLSSIDTIDISNNSRLCKAYNFGKYVHETENLGYVYSMTIDYGGSSDPFDELRHCVCFDDRATIIGEYKGTDDVPDSILDTNDGHKDSEAFATRAEAMQALYEAAGSPAVKGSSRFTDVSANAPYAKAVKWGEDHKICFGYPMISSDTFCPDELISRQDFALMAHRFADCMKLGTAFDYGRTDWFKDYSDIDFYAWGPFTWSIQWGVLSFDKDHNVCNPHGRLTDKELSAGVYTIFHLDEGAAYSGIVGGNDGNPGEK